MNEMVRAIRNTRAEMQIPPSEKTELIIVGSDLSQEWKMAKEHQTILTALTPTSQAAFAPAEPSAFGASALVGPLKLMIPIPDSLRVREKGRLEKEREKLEKLKESTQSKLANSEFRSRAPQEVVGKLQDALSQTEKQLAEIAEKLQKL